MIRARFKSNEDGYRSINWPEATDIDSEEVEEYQFTGRFPKPD